MSIISLATSLPETNGCRATRWTLDQIAAQLRAENGSNGISRSTIWRVLNELDLKVHKCQNWLTSHDQDFDVKAQEICQLYVHAQQLYERGIVVICCDEKTGIRVLERIAPTRPAHPSGSVPASISDAATSPPAPSQVPFGRLPDFFAAADVPRVDESHGSAYVYVVNEPGHHRQYRDNGAKTGPDH